MLANERGRSAVTDIFPEVPIDWSVGSTAGMTEEFKSANLAEAIGMSDIQMASGIGMVRTFGIAATKVGARAVLSEGEVYRPINLASPH